MKKFLCIPCTDTPNVDFDSECTSVCCKSQLTSGKSGDLTSEKHKTRKRKSVEQTSVEPTPAEQTSVERTSVERTSGESS